MLHIYLIKTIKNGFEIMKKGKMKWKEKNILENILINNAKNSLEIQIIHQDKLNIKNKKNKKFI